MRFFRIHSHFAAWLAMLALVLSSFAPLIAQAVVVNSTVTSQTQTFQVCSTSGLVWVKLDQKASASDFYQNHTPFTDKDATKHCPWCHLHTDASLPVTPSDLDLLQQQANSAPLFYRNPRTSTAWAQAHARAPPLSS